MSEPYIPSQTPWGQAVADPVKWAHEWGPYAEYAAWEHWLENLDLTGGDDGDDILTALAENGLQVALFMAFQKAVDHYSALSDPLNWTISAVSTTSPEDKMPKAESLAAKTLQALGKVTFAELCSTTDIATPVFSIVDSVVNFGENPQPAPDVVVGRDVIHGQLHETANTERCAAMNITKEQIRKLIIWWWQDNATEKDQWGYPCMDGKDIQLGNLADRFFQLITNEPTDEQPDPVYNATKACPVTIMKKARMPKDAQP